MPLSAPPASWTTLLNKPTTVAGFGISDMASQTVANATNATNVTNVTTTQVMNATASATVGGVGAYSFLMHSADVPTATNATVAGSSLRYADTSGSIIGGAVSGTWRCMGISSNNGAIGRATAWVRIS